MATTASPSAQNCGFDGQSPRLVAVELEGREELDIFDRFDVPARHEARGCFCESLDSHYARQYRRAVNPVVIKERLLGRIQRSLNAEPSLERLIPVTAQTIGP